MKRLSLFGLALLTVLVANVVTAVTASADSTPLPDIHTALPGETYPLNLGGHLTGVGKLKGSSGGLLETSEFSDLLSVKELTSLGDATIEFLGLVKAGTTERCNTEGDSEANGEVLVPNAEFHLVYTALSPAEALALSILVLFTPFRVLCVSGTFEVELRGPATSRVNVPTPEAGKEGDSTRLETATKCATPATTGLQEIPYYFNDALEKVPTTLLLNVAGSGFANACEEITGTVLLMPAGGSATMFSVLF